MLTLLATTLANYAPSVQQQTRLSMSRVTGVSQPIQDVVQQLRGGGESCDVILVTKLVHKASPLYRASRSEPLLAGGLRLHLPRRWSWCRGQRRALGASTAIRPGCGN